MEAASRYLQRRWWVPVGLLAVAGFALRLKGILESPYGDELILWQLVHGRGFGSMLAQVVEQEKTPPLGFILAWGAAKIGPADPWMRVPSLLAGTALIPLTGLLARRCFGPLAGLFAAAFTAFSPFLVFYGSEARSYSLAAAFACASLVLLLTATDRDDRATGLWVGWAATAAAAALCHYTAIPLLLAAAVWALVYRPAHRKRLAVAAAGALLACAWWLPSLATQSGHAGDEAKRIAFLAPLSLDSVWQVASRALIGSPIWTSIRSLGLTEVPGKVGLVLICAGLAAGTFAAIANRQGGPAKDTTRLLAIAALITPVVLVIASLRPHHSLLLPRNAIVSVAPAFALAGGLFERACSGRRRWGAGAAGLVAAGLLLGSLVELRDYSRPAMTQAAKAVNERWQPGDEVLYANYFSGPPNDLRIHLGPRESAALQLTRTVGAQPFLDALLSGHSVFTVAPDVATTPHGIEPPPALAAVFRKTWEQTWHGMLDVTAAQWTPVRPRAKATSK